MSVFFLPPSPPVLHWLSAGQLSNRLHRTVRIWWLLQQIYGQSQWAIDLPVPFGYPDLRDRLFADTHPCNDNLRVSETLNQCTDSACLCYRTLKELLFTPETQQTEPEWLQAITELAGLSSDDLQQQLQAYPFATVHRSLRDDLKFLAQQGWLTSHDRGRYQVLPLSRLPSLPQTTSPSNGAILSSTQTWELLRVLEAIAFVQPNLELIVQSLWEQATQLPRTPHFSEEPSQRIFIHLDYILAPETQEQVDTYQDQVEQLWHTCDGGVIQFDYWLVKQQQKRQVTVYPVCLHYARRAKYLSAYGVDPFGDCTWHNYRLDRIVSDHLKVLPWGDPAIPKPLKALWRTGQLPTSEMVRDELEVAWGFNFYLPRSLLLLRFPTDFARWYIDDTIRHPTFEAINYQQLPALIRKEIPNPEERRLLLQLIKQRSATDAYYRAWIRLGDINVLMRLRDWRPNGEVLAPISIRQQMAMEVELERQHYRN